MRTTEHTQPHSHPGADIRPFPRLVRVPEDSRREPYPERAPGVGYGNSSGYASERRYARGWNGQPLFRCG